jgi:hypothetical protein
MLKVKLYKYCFSKGISGFSIIHALFYKYIFSTYLMVALILGIIVDLTYGVC